MSETRAPAPSSTFHHGDAEPLLRWCEAQKFTGTLTVVADRVRVEIPLLAGVAEVATAKEGDDPVLLAVDLFLRASEGSYTLVQQLPPVVGATARDPRTMTGNFALLSPADVMRYCEDTGLTGELVLALHDTPPRRCTALYERGELISLTLDGRDDLDVASIFEWSNGTFAINAFSLFERDPSERDPLLRAPPAPEQGQLLRTVEVGLSDLLARRSLAPTTAPRRTSFRPPREAAEVEAVIPQSPRLPNLDIALPVTVTTASADTTVKVYFVQARKPAAVDPLPTSDPPAVVEAPRVSAGDLVGPARQPMWEMGLWAVIALAVVIATVSLVGLLQRV